MAPELFASATNFSKAVDVYAFGVVLGEVFTSEVPSSLFIRAATPCMDLLERSRARNTALGAVLAQLC